MLSIILIVVLILLLFGMLPTWPHTVGWGYGYYPSGFIAVVLLIVVLLLLTGRI